MVEDDPRDAELILRELRNSGFDPIWQRVDTEADYLAGLEAGWDIVLSDYRLPQFNGLRALELLKERDLNIPFVIVSGTIGEETAVEAMKKGAADYLLKDRLARLGPAIDHALDQQQARKILRESEEHIRQERVLLRTLIDSIPDLIFLKDKDSVFLGCNKSFEKYAGLTEKELIGRTDFDLVARETALGYRRQDHALLVSGQARRTEEWIPFKGGGGGYFETVKTPYYGPDGKSLGLIGVSRDITERKQAAENMRIVLERLQMAAQAAQAGIWELDLSSNEASWDDQMFAIFGQKPGPDRKKGMDRWLQAMHPDDIGRYTALMEEVLDKKLPSFDIEFRITRANDDARRLIRSMGMVKYDTGGHAVRMIGLNRDVTGERQREEELARALAKEKELSEKARAGDRAKSEFLAVMSHEVRTPLNGILGFADLLSNAPSLSPECQSYSRIIVQSGEALLRILDDILDFSRLEAGRLQVEVSHFFPRKMLEEIRGLFMKEAEDKHLELAVSVDASTPRCLEGDAGRLRQVLLNLVGNAIKFTGRGSITISLHPAPDRTSHFIFSVKDTGDGIPSEQMERIFQPFTQVDSSISRRYGGTGLGLAISRRLIELMGGELTVRSELGQGSEFFMAVPLRVVEEEPAAAFPRKPIDATFAREHPLRILLVEDDSVNLKLIQSIVRRFGYEPLAAQNGREAVEIYRKEHPNCLFMDLQMPEMDGITATGIIRDLEKSSPETKPAFISALTANIFPSERRRCLDAGMNGYLNKPIKIPALAEMLATASAFENGVSPMGK